MKKIFSLLVIIVFFLSLAYAEEVTVDTVKPNIQATFNETVNLTGASLEYLADGSFIQLSNTTSDSKVFTFTPITSLLNGFYYFVVNAADLIGNAKLYTQNIIVNVEETRIFFVSPRHGIATTSNFSLVLGTTRKAACRWSYMDQDYGDMTALTEDSQGLTHTTPITGARNIEQGTDQPELDPIPIFVKCQDEFGFNISNQFGIGYDPATPIIKRIQISNNPVITYPPQTDISVFSDDNVVCFLNGDVFSTQAEDNLDSYSYSPVTTITYAADTTSNGKYNYNIVCKNLATTSTAASTATVTVSLQAALAITINSPAAYTGKDVVYDITTNKASSCSATTDRSSTADLAPDAAKTHHTLIPAISGNATQHSVHFECRAGSEQVSADQSFLIDTTAPAAPVINASACTKDTISLAFYSYDNESGIKGFNYSIVGSNLSISPKFISGSTAQETKLNLSLGSQYSIQSVAINRANLVSGLTTTSFTFNPNSTPACWEKIPPVLRLNVTNSSYGKLVTILCSDDSGCDLSTIKYGLSADTNCTPTIASSQATVQSTQNMCYEGSDIYGNKATGITLISFEPSAASCYDGIKDGNETDVDCGGSCSPCTAGLACSSNLDCDTNSCINSTCIRTSCTDGIKNGFETDVDCGGKDCTPCASGKSCTANSDCGTNFCGASSTCEATSCTDGIKNGFETDVDCGGKDCTPCKTGSVCSKDSDCQSGSCQFSSCTSAAVETFEQWAARNGINPADRDKKYDGKSWTNYEEYLRETGQYVAPATPGFLASLPNYLALLLGIIIVVAGIVLLYYFKADQNTSFYVIGIGVVILLAALLGILFSLIPAPILIALTVIGLAGAGYLSYTQKKVIVQKIAKQPLKAAASAAQKAQTTVQGAQPAVTAAGEAKPEALTKEELSATQQMIEMIKKQRENEIKSREAVFGKFEEKKPAKEKEEKAKGGKTEAIEPIKAKIIARMPERTTPVVQFVQKPMKKTAQEQAAKKPESEFERLSEISGKEKEETQLEKLSKLTEQKKTPGEKPSREEAFDRLSKISRSKTEDIFSKLPSSGRNISELSEIGKKKSKRGGKK